jgi:hypothetical protein
MSDLLLPPPERVGVVDTDVVVDELEAIVTNPNSTVLFAARHIRWFAASHVLREMYQPDRLGNRHKFDKLSSQLAAKGHAMNPDDIQGVFETRILPLIRFVDVDQVMNQHPFTAAVDAIDSKDAPTGQLAALLSGVGVLVMSRDHSLRKPGLARSNAAELKQYAIAATQGHETLAGVVLVGELSVRIVNAGAAKAARRLGTSPALVWVLLAAAGAYAVSGSDRRTKLRAGAGVVANALAELVVAGEQAKTELAALWIDSEDDSIEVQIANALALAPTPISVDELWQSIPSSCRELAVTKGELRNVMRKANCFVSVPNGRWQLGAVHGRR